MNNLQRFSGNCVLAVSLVATTYACAETGLETGAEISTEPRVEQSQVGQEETTVPLTKKQRQDFRLQQQALLQEGYALYQQQDYTDALQLLFDGYAKDMQQPQDKNEWMGFFLALSLEKQGFTQAAVDILAQLVIENSNTEIVHFSLQLFENLSRNKPFDRTTIIDQILLDHDFGFIDDPQILAFIHYHKGMYDWKNKQQQWAKAYFNKLPEHSLYAHKYRYHQAL
ncbi:MAG: hypothetical protein HRU20_26285, partial [Pseudomonadales bacterium]|nr:hypothetical protein [Pseudomonadales bacterium]